jgi:hypothetical protein
MLRSTGAGDDRSGAGATVAVDMVVDMVVAVSVGAAGGCEACPQARHKKLTIISGRTVYPPHTFHQEPEA